MRVDPSGCKRRMIKQVFIVLIDVVVRNETVSFLKRTGDPISGPRRKRYPSIYYIQFQVFVLIFLMKELISYVPKTCFYHVKTYLLLKGDWLGRIKRQENQIKKC